MLVPYSLPTSFSVGSLVEYLLILERISRCQWKGTRVAFKSMGINCIALHHQWKYVSIYCSDIMIINL